MRARASVRSLTRDFESLVDAAHRDELARAEQQMRVDALAERAMAELGLEAAALLARVRTGPARAGAHQPSNGAASDRQLRTPNPSLCRYVRDEQLQAAADR